MAGGKSALVIQSAGGPLARVPAMAVRKMTCEVAERPLAATAESGGSPAAAFPAVDTHAVPSVTPRVVHRIEGVDPQEWVVMAWPWLKASPCWVW